MRIEFKEFLHNIKEHDYDVCGQYKVDQSEAKKLINAFEDLEKTTANSADGMLNNFQCRECGLIIKGYEAGEYDTEYVDNCRPIDFEFDYCPNCGRRIIKKEFKRFGYEHDM